MISEPIKFAEKFNTKSSRLLNYNYSAPGPYFITVCTYKHNNFFGKILKNKMIFSKMGIVANQCLIDIPKHFANVCLDAFIVMPNHVHILFHVETPDLASLQEHSKVRLIKYSHRNHPDYYLRLNELSKQLIPKIVQQYKSTVTRQINPKTIFFAWQPRYYDEIIKDGKKYLKIKNYIINNPTNWQKDKYYTES